MKYALWCTRCGQPRTMRTDRAYRNTGGRPHADQVPHARLTCFRCGSTEFYANKAYAPTIPAGWMLTPFDRELLATMQIARGIRAEVRRT